MDFKSLKSYVIYMRYKRSGSALLANLLDAHHNIIFPRNEDFFVKYDRWTREQGFEHLYNTSKKYRTKPFYANGYKYPIEGVGYCEEPKVIGHKSSTRNFLPLCNDRSLLENFQLHMQLPLKFIHLVRNPYEMVNARWQQKEWRRKNAPVGPIIDHLEEVVRAQYNLYRRTDLGSYFQIHLEQLIAAPPIMLSELLYFLGVDIDQEYFQRCSKLIFNKPEVYETLPEWQDKDKDRIERLMDQHPGFFEVYRS